MEQIRNTRLLQKIALTLKDLRDEHNVSQEDMYNEINIHIGRIESGTQNVSVSTIAAICKYFNISLSDFFKKVESIR